MRIATVFVVATASACGSAAPPSSTVGDAAIAACWRDVSLERPEAALAEADRVLRVRPTDWSAASCRDHALEIEHRRAALERINAVLRGGDPEAAFAAVQDLPDGSPLLERDDVRRVLVVHAQRELAAARASLASDPRGAAERAHAVRLTSAVTPALCEEALEIEGTLPARISSSKRTRATARCAATTRAWCASSRPARITPTRCRY